MYGVTINSIKEDRRSIWFKDKGNDLSPKHVLWGIELQTEETVAYIVLGFRKEVLVRDIDLGIISIYSRKLRPWEWVRMPKESP